SHCGSRQYSQVSAARSQTSRFSASFMTSRGRGGRRAQSAARLGVDQVEEVADALVTLQDGAFGRRESSLAVLLRQFVDAGDGGLVEPKAEQRLRHFGRHPRSVGFKDLFQDFCLGGGSGWLGHVV